MPMVVLTLLKRAGISKEATLHVHHHIDNSTYYQRIHSARARMKQQVFGYAKTFLLQPVLEVRKHTTSMALASQTSVSIAPCV
ncbi:hypothetical protein [Paenibacillus wenxiniae]|uniref:Uncharacterized protein n=1 Tax=Paenibacillus wenxiniae TaxID=1636843 RepID=A0ABW4RIN7_9BACL